MSEAGDRSSRQQLRNELMERAQLQRQVAATCGCGEAAQVISDLMQVYEASLAAVLSSGPPLTRLRDDLREPLSRVVELLSAYTTPPAVEARALVLEVLSSGPPTSEAERTVKSIAVMLGWENVPPQRVLEQEISILKERASASGGLQASPAAQEKESK